MYLDKIKRSLKHQDLAGDDVQNLSFCNWNTSNQIIYKIRGAPLSVKKSTQMRPSGWKTQDPEEQNTFLHIKGSIYSICSIW